MTTTTSNGQPPIRAKRRLVSRSQGESGTPIAIRWLRDSRELWVSVACVLATLIFLVDAVLDLVAWVAPAVAGWLVERCPWLIRGPVLNMPETPMGMLVQGCVGTVYSAGVAVWLARHPRRSARPGSVSSGSVSSKPIGFRRVARYWGSRAGVICCVFFAFIAVLFAQDAIELAWPPVVRVLESWGLGQPEWSATPYFTGSTSSINSAAEDWVQAVAIGIGSAWEEISLVAVLVLWLRRYRIGWGWIIGISVILRLGIHLHLGWMAFPRALCFGFFSVAVFVVYRSIFGQWVAHLWSNFTVTAGESIWISAPAWLIAWQTWGRPVAAMIGSLIMIAVPLRWGMHVHRRERGGLAEVGAPDPT